MPLDEAMARTDGHITFRPQAEFLEAGGADHELRLFPLERIGEALAEIGHTPLWTNVTHHKYDRAEVEAHPAFPAAMSRYEADWKLRKDLGYGVSFQD